MIGAHGHLSMGNAIGTLHHTVFTECRRSRLFSLCAFMYPFSLFLILEVVCGGGILTVFSFPESSIPFFRDQQNMEILGRAILYTIYIEQVSTTVEEHTTRNTCHTTN